MRPDARPQTGKTGVYSLEYVEYIEDFCGPRTPQLVAIVRRSRTVNVGQAPRRAGADYSWAFLLQSPMPDSSGTGETGGKSATGAT